MAEQNTGNPQPGAEQRIAQERDAALAEAAELKAQLAAAKVSTQAATWLAGKGITGDAAGQWLQAMNPHFANFQDGDIGAQLDAQFGSLIPTQAAAAVPPTDGTPPPVAPDTPAPTGGSPAAPPIATLQPGAGSPITETVVAPLIPGSDEWKQKVEQDPRGAIKALEEIAASGREIAFTPGGEDSAYPMVQTTRTVRG